MNLKTLAKKAGYSVTRTIVPQTYYTITNLETGLTSNMGPHKQSVITAFLGECKTKGYILQIKE